MSDGFVECSVLLAAGSVSAGIPGEADARE